VLTSRHVSLGGIIWIVIGLFVAATHHFLKTLDTVSTIGSAILAVMLWPLVLLKVHIAI
jgi:hypothetical protein